MSRPIVRCLACTLIIVRSPAGDPVLLARAPGRPATPAAAVAVGVDWLLRVGTRGRRTSPESAVAKRSRTATFLVRPCSPSMNADSRRPATLSRWFRVAAAAVVCLSMSSLVACETSARFETTGGGHPISATVSGPLTIDSRDTHATIASPSGIVTIERTRARIDDGPWETIPEDVPLRVTMSKHTVSIRAGSVTIVRTIR